MSSGKPSLLSSADVELNLEPQLVANCLLA
jgi:hypothetical protein